MNNFRVLIFGLPGSGKTTYCVKRILDALSEGYIVFTNIEVIFEGHTVVGISNSKFFKFIVKLIIKSLNKKIGKMSLIKIDRFYPTIENTRQRLTIDYKIRHYKKWVHRLENMLVPQLYDLNNFVFTTDFKAVVKQIKELPIEKAKVVIWDEGFIDFAHQNSPSSSYAEFFNQGRHFNCDLVISSQRAVAIFPTFRALCDYALECRKRWGRFIEVRKYYLDSSTSLPQEQDGRVYDFFSIKKYFMFFNTLQRHI